MKIIVLFIIILSLLLLIRFVFFFQNQHVYRVGDTLEKEITILSEPRILFGKQILDINSIQIEVPETVEVHYGDTVSIYGEIEEDSFTTKSGEDVTILTIKSAEINQLGTTNPFILSTAFIRNRVWDVFQRTIPRSEAGLLFGILFGGSQGFSKDMKDAFRNTGVLHVVAASGMNVTMVAAFLFAVTSRFLKRQIAILASVLGIFYYALLAGFEPSILRASIMAGIAFSAGILGRQNYAFLTLLITGWVMLMITPENLFDIGFLLSFSSTLGILMIKPFLDTISFAKRTKGISDDINTTVAAQVGSLPFMGAFFSSYSLISIVVNALILWTIPLIMIVGAVAVGCAIMMPYVTFIPLYITLPLLWYFEKMIMLFSSVPLLKFSDIPWVIWVGYYLILLAVYLKLKKKNEK